MAQISEKNIWRVRWLCSHLHCKMCALPNFQETFSVLVGMHSRCATSSYVPPPVSLNCHAKYNFFSLIFFVVYPLEKLFFFYCLVVLLFLSPLWSKILHCWVFLFFGFFFKELHFKFKVFLSIYLFIYWKIWCNLSLFVATCIQAAAAIHLARWAFPAFVLWVKNYISGKCS